MADTMKISSELCPRVKPAGLTEKVLSPEFLGIRLNRVEEVAAVETHAVMNPSPQITCERPGHVRLDDEKPADDRHGGDRIADGREKVFRGGGIGADDLADDGGGGAIERDADRAQEKEHGACREPRGVVAGGENVGAVGETEGCHRKGNGAEEDAYAIVHNRSFCYAPACKS